MYRENGVCNTIGMHAWWYNTHGHARRAGNRVDRCMITDMEHMRAEAHLCARYGGVHKTWVQC